VGPAVFLKTKLGPGSKMAENHWAIRSEISEEQCLKRIPDLVGSRTVLLRLGSDNSCPTVRPK